MIELPLTQGKVALIDDADYDLVAQHKWYAIQNHGVWYGQTHVRTEDGRWRTSQMHTMIMGRGPKGHTVDHRNGDGLDNQRGNLRWATRSQQGCNRSPSRTNRSGYKGVYQWPGARDQWAAQITRGRHQRHLGLFPTPELAARAYDAKAIELFGEFARLNFPAS